MSTRDLLLRGIRARADAQASAWLEDALARTGTGTQNTLLELYTAASTRLGATKIGLTTADLEKASAASSVVPEQRDANREKDEWAAEDGGRLALLLVGAEAAPSAEAFFEDACACYEQGDAREQRSWLRGVALLPGPERFLPLVVDACRTNILPNFEAVACGNPYPARYFPERNFNQLVLKALFNNVSLARIVGLAERANAELSRMAADYAAERKAAGRSVPADIGMAMVGT